MRSAAHISGFEHAWLAVDVDGHVALFTTAGGGYVPPESLADADGYEAAIDEILAIAPFTRALREPSIGAGLESTWRRMAERGCFAFDSDVLGGPYRLVAVPSEPVRVGELGG